MSKSERARSQPEGAQRKAPGRGSDGDYYHVAVRNKSQFKTFRTHDVGDPGGIQRVAGQRKSGTWGTVKWLIPKEWAHMKGGKLIADSDDARKVLEQLGSAPVHSSADMFEAKTAPQGAGEGQTHQGATTGAPGEHQEGATGRAPARPLTPLKACRRSPACRSGPRPRPHRRRRRRAERGVPWRPGRAACGPDREGYRGLR